MGEKGNGNGASDDGIEPKQEEGQPRTQERPGTGTPDPKRQPPPKRTEGGRATGQITDNSGKKYGPVQHSEPIGGPTGESTGYLPGEPGEPGASGRFPDEPPGAGRGQITDHTGRYGPEKRSR